LDVFAKRKYSGSYSYQIINKIKTHFSTTIHILCTNNALEFTKKSLIFLHLMVFYTRVLVHKLHSKMGLLKKIETPKYSLHLVDSYVCTKNFLD